MLKKITLTDKENDAFHEISFQDNGRISSVYKLKQDKRFSACMLLAGCSSDWKKRFMKLTTSNMKWSEEKKAGSSISVLDNNHMHTAYLSDQSSPEDWCSLASLIRETAMLKPVFIADQGKDRLDPAWKDEQHRAYAERFSRWYSSLSLSSQKEVQKMYPEPFTWKGYWNHSDQEDTQWINDYCLCFCTEDGQYHADTEGTMEFHYLLNEKEPVLFSEMNLQKNMQEEKKKFLSALQMDSDAKIQLLHRYHLSMNASDEEIWNRSRLTILFNILYFPFYSSASDRKALLNTGKKELLFTGRNSVLSEKGENLLGKALTMIRENLRSVYSFEKNIIFPEKPAAEISDSKMASSYIRHAWSLSEQKGFEKSALHYAEKAVKADPANAEGWLLAASLSAQISVADTSHPSRQCASWIAHSLISEKNNRETYISASEALLAWILDTMLASFHADAPYSEENLQNLLEPVQTIREMLEEIEIRTSLYEIKAELDQSKIYSSAVQSMNAWIAALRNQNETEEIIQHVMNAFEEYMPNSSSL